MPSDSPMLTRHVDAFWPSERMDELFEAADAVRALTGSRGWAAVLAVVQGEIDTIEEQLGSSRTALPHADYALMHGRLGGLRATTDAARAIVGRAEKRFAEQRARHDVDAESSTER